MRGEDRDNRDDLAEEHQYGDIGQVIAVIIFLIVWALDSFVFRLSTFLSNCIPIYIRLILSVLSFAFAGYLAMSSHKAIFDEVRDTPRVISTGLFSYLRHPLYLAALLFYVGFLFTTLSIISLVLFVVVFIFYDYIAAFEEKQLEKKFGQEYIDYKKKTPKWLPSFISQKRSV